MSLHVEWVSAVHMSGDIVPAGSQIGEDIVAPGNVAAVIWCDEAVVIEGPKDALRRHLRKLLEELEGVEPGDAIPPDYVPTD